MNQKDLDDLQKATTLIFNVEQKWRKDKYDYAADTLYKARIEINNARSRGQRTKEDRDLKYVTILHHKICYYFDSIEPTIENDDALWCKIQQEIIRGKIMGELRIVNQDSSQGNWEGFWSII